MEVFEQVRTYLLVISSVVHLLSFCRYCGNDVSYERPPRPPPKPPQLQCDAMHTKAGTVRFLLGTVT